VPDAHADVVVIGAGAFGVSTAYHLAARGLDVTLVDKFDIGSQTSPRAAGLTQQIRPTPLMTEIARRSVEKLVTFSEETGEDLDVHQSGSVKIAKSETFSAQLRGEVSRGQDVGLDIDLVSPREAEALAPFLDASHAVACWYTRSDLFLEPGHLVRAYARAAERLGVRLLPNAEVVAIETRNAEVHGVVTALGRLRTSTVIDTAGAWTGLVSRMAGIDVPIVPTRHQLYITKPIEGVESTQPIVRVLDHNVYVRPERGGLMFGGYEPDPLQVDMEKRSPGFQVADLELDFEGLRGLTQATSTEFPALVGAEVDEFRGGLPTMTADGEHIIDRVPGMNGLFVASGCCVGGLSVSPAVGEILAEWVLSGRPPVDMAAMSLQRFGPGVQSRTDLLAQCSWRYSHHYHDT
jgi:glycine/D-amino acid oxidase-like deaminating enzyme